MNKSDFLQNLIGQQGRKIWQQKSGFYWKDTTNNDIIQDKVKKNGFLAGEQSESHSKQRCQWAYVPKDEIFRGNSRIFVWMEIKSSKRQQGRLSWKACRSQKKHI